MQKSNLQKKEKIKYEDIKNRMKLKLKENSCIFIEIKTGGKISTNIYPGVRTIISKNIWKKDLVNVDEFGSFLFLYNSYNLIIENKFVKCGIINKNR